MSEGLHDGRIAAANDARLRAEAERDALQEQLALRERMFLEIVEEQEDAEAEVTSLRERGNRLAEALEQIANHRYSDERSWDIAAKALTTLGRRHYAEGEPMSDTEAKERIAGWWRDKLAEAEAERDALREQNRLLQEALGELVEWTTAYIGPHRVERLPAFHVLTRARQALRETNR